jgi:cytochrome b subunit of formate dehydrogenase
MTLKFSYLGWAQGISAVLGGFESAGYLHRICAIITFAYFGIHAWDLFRKKRASGLSWFRYLMHPASMIPNRKDLSDLIATFRWFVGRGPRPAYGRWTYWEKFDYFAVFWGVAIIGATGLMLWFPEWFTYVLPGWIINVATIIHSDEALLAVAFIFTVHFFNTHFRPDRFPMDTVIFTGRVPVDELRDDRPLEYEQLVQSGELEKNLVDPLPPYVESAFRVFGWIALIVGLSLVLLILWAELFGYR